MIQKPLLYVKLLFKRRNLLLNIFYKNSTKILISDIKLELHKYFDFYIIILFYYYLMYFLTENF